jgi:hypothetical protein
MIVSAKIRIIWLANTLPNHNKLTICGYFSTFTKKWKDMDFFQNYFLKILFNLSCIVC